jgi:predicted sulfurtransferase
MLIRHIAGYKFTHLGNLPGLQQSLFAACEHRQLKGTLLLSQEGINVSLAGLSSNIHDFQDYLKKEPAFADMTFRESHSAIPPYKRLKVKIKNEIITLKQPDIHPDIFCAPRISPETLKKWLDEKRDFTLLDTRNTYEYRFGSFIGATHLATDDFSEFPHVIAPLSREKPIVMFCTGGIRCEKAGLYLLKENFQEVYQLDGGILNYFAKIGGTHYQGECFVFDDRIALNPDLTPSGNRQCQACQGPSADFFCETCIT